MKENKTGMPGKISFATSTGTTKWGNAKSTTYKENSNACNEEAIRSNVNKNLFYYDENNPQRKFNK